MFPSEGRHIKHKLFLVKGWVLFQEQSETLSGWQRAIRALAQTQVCTEYIWSVNICIQCINGLDTSLITGLNWLQVHVLHWKLCLASRLVWFRITYKNLWPLKKMQMVWFQRYFETCSSYFFFLTACDAGDSWTHSRARLTCSKQTSFAFNRHSGRFNICWAKSTPVLNFLLFSRPQPSVFDRVWQTLFHRHLCFYISVTRYCVIIFKNYLA